MGGKRGGVSGSSSGGKTPKLDPKATYGDFIPGGVDETPPGFEANDPDNIQAVAVQAPDGSIGTVAPADLKQALDAGAQRVDGATYEAAQAAAAEKARLDTVGNTLAAGAEGFGRGLTFGGFDAAAIYGTKLFDPTAGENVRKHLEELKAAHPLAAGIGEVAGAIAPLALSAGAAAPLEGANLARVGVEGASLAREATAGSRLVDGAAALGKVANAPARALAGAGTLAERAATAIVGDSAESLGGRILQKMASKGAQGAMEGGLFNVANDVDESVLGDTQLSGEKLLASFGHGALLGGAAGSAIGAAGELGHAVVGKLAGKMQNLADSEAWSYVGGKQAFSKEAERIPGGVRAVGKELNDRGLIRAGETIEEGAPRIAAEREKVGQQLGDMLQSADAAGMQGPRIADIETRIKDSVLPDLMKMEGTNASAIGKIRTVVDDLKNYAGIPANEFGHRAAGEARLTFKQAQEFRARVDDLIKWSTNPMAPVNETTVALKGIRHAIEDELVSAGEGAAKKMGASFAEPYNDLKLSYRKLALADKAAQDTVIRANGKAASSLTDKLFGAAAMGVGMAHGGIMGAGAGLVAQQASKIIRTRGNSTAAVMLDKLAAIGGVERATQRFDREVDRGLAGFFKPGERVAPKVKVRTFDAPADEHKPGHSYASRVEQVAKAVADAETHVGNTQKAVSSLSAHAPNVANSFQSAALRATTYLHSQIPQGHRDLTSLTPQATKDGAEVPHYAQADFNRKFDVVAGGPVVVLKHMADGTLTKAEVDAADHVFPEVMKEVRAKAMDALASQKKPLPYAKDLQARLLLGLPRKGTTLDPKFVGSMQSTYAQGGSKAQPPAAPKHVLGNALAGAATLTGQSKI